MAEISFALVNEQGNALLEDFYEESVQPLDEQLIYFLEDTLINADGHRENVTTETLYKNKNKWKICATVNALEQAHLLRIFSYANVQRVEFAHDVLCPIIVRRRNLRKSRSQFKRAQIVGLIAFFSYLILLFGGIAIYDVRSHSKESIRKQKERLAEMEVALQEKCVENMLKSHDIYGVIQLLINSIGDDFSSSITARKELLLRQAWDSLCFAKDSIVAKVHYQVYMPDIMMLSPSGRLAGVPDNSERVLIIDSHTGSIVQAISTHYPVQMFDYNAFSASNAHNWHYLVQDNQIVNSLQSYGGVTALYLCDIHPNDSLCLITNDNALYECYIMHGDYYEHSGHARMCIHDFPAIRDRKIRIADAAYSENGSEIAIKVVYDSIKPDGFSAYDEWISKYYLFDAADGNRIDCDNSTERAKQLIQLTENRFGEYEDDELWSSILHVSKDIKLQFEGRNLFVYQKHDQSVPDDEIYTIYSPDTGQEEKTRLYIDTLSSLPDVLTSFTRSFYLDGEDHSRAHVDSMRYHWPLAISPDNKRVVMLSPPSIWYPHQYNLYGIYLHNGAIFFKKSVAKEVHSLHFTEEGERIIVNAGSDDQLIFHVPSLPNLVDSCKNMFFDWTMTDEERYQTYIHMNY